LIVVENGKLSRKSIGPHHLHIPCPRQIKIFQQLVLTNFATGPTIIEEYILRLTNTNWLPMVIATFKENGMRKILVIAGLAVLSTSAMASSARMAALGGDATIGSLYIDDTRNVLVDASVINTFKDYAITEWGAVNNTYGAGTGRAEGGFFKSMGSLNYGAYMNSDAFSQNSTRGANATGYAGQALVSDATVTRKNNIDLIVGGDMGVQWGARLSYAKNNGARTAQTQKQGRQGSLGMGLGVTAGSIGGYLNTVLNDKSQGADSNTSDSVAGSTWEDDGTMNLGASYLWGDYKFAADYDAKGFKVNKSGSGAEMKSEQTVITVGAMKTHKISGNSKVWCGLDLQKTTAEDTHALSGSSTTPVATAKTEFEKFAMPLTVAFEVDAASWLTWRGSVKHELSMFTTQTTTLAAGTNTTTDPSHKVRQTPGTTTVAAGATLNFGKLMVDGTLGMSGVAGSSKLDSSAMLSNVGVHYWF
jgi:hypothetical protein